MQHLIATSFVCIRSSGTASSRVSEVNRGLIAPALALAAGSHVSVPDFGLTEANEIGQAVEFASNKLVNAQFNATDDSLTGLPNRFLFYEIAAKQFKVAPRDKSVFSLLFIDLDGFKQIND